MLSHLLINLILFLYFWGVGSKKTQKFSVDLSVLHCTRLNEPSTHQTLSLDAIPSGFEPGPLMTWRASRAYSNSFKHSQHISVIMLEPGDLASYLIVNAVITFILSSLVASDSVLVIPYVVSRCCFSFRSVGWLMKCGVVSTYSLIFQTG